jgi:hypothetical protein
MQTPPPVTPPPVSSGDIDMWTFGPVLKRVDSTTQVMSTDQQQFFAGLSDKVDGLFAVVQRDFDAQFTALNATIGQLIQLIRLSIQGYQNAATVQNQLLELNQLGQILSTLEAIQQRPATMGLIPSETATIPQPPPSNVGP